MTVEFKEAWHWTHKPDCCVLYAARKLRHSSHPPSQVCGALLPVLFVRHLWGPLGNVALVSSLPLHACRSRPGAQNTCQKLLRASRQTVCCCPHFPLTPAWLHWFVLILFSQMSHWISSVKHLSSWLIQKEKIILTISRILWKLYYFSGLLFHL